jgi:hypothetical protein
VRRRRPRQPATPVPPPRIRRFVASEWGWDGPRYDDGGLVLGHYEAERRYFAAWSAWMDDNGVELVTWWDLYGQPPMVPDEPFDGASL